MFLVADLHTKRPNCTNTSSPSVLPDHERFAHQDRCNTAGPRISPRTENPRWNFAEVGLAVTVYCHSWFLALIRRLEKVRAAVGGGMGFGMSFPENQIENTRADYEFHMKIPDYFAISLYVRTTRSKYWCGAVQNAGFYGLWPILPSAGTSPTQGQWKVN